MTTIAYRAGIMASDSGSWAGDASHGWARKLVKGADGTLYGVAGDAAQADGFLKWVSAGRLDPAPVIDRQGTDGCDSSIIILAVTPGGPIRLITARGEECYPDAPYYAIGSGAATAFGALFMGATAEQAIEAAKEHGSGAFGRVQSLRHPTTRKKPPLKPFSKKGNITQRQADAAVRKVLKK